MFQPDVSLYNQDFPMDTIVFNGETQSVISLMSQFLGLDIDKYVTESLMSLLFSYVLVHLIHPSQVILVSLNMMNS